MELLSPTDSIFLIGESREHPMHVGGLQLFDPPADAPEGFVHDLYEKVAALTDFSPMFRKRPATLLGGIASISIAPDVSIRDLASIYRVDEGEIGPLVALDPHFDDLGRPGHLVEADVARRHQAGDAEPDGLEVEPLRRW